MPSTTKDDLRGLTFGFLRPIEFLPDDSDFSKWACLCVCGKRHVVMAQSLKRGATKSCGCKAVEVRLKKQTKHGQSGSKRSKTYNSWAGMMDRCVWLGHPSSKHYHARGITVCEEWHDFERFLADMGERPDGTSIGRLDNDKGYSLENCRWETRREQSLNTRRTIWILYEGQKVTLFEFCENNNISRKAVRARAHRRGGDYVAALRSMGIECEAPPVAA